MQTESEAKQTQENKNKLMELPTIVEEQSIYIPDFNIVDDYETPFESQLAVDNAIDILFSRLFLKMFSNEIDGNLWKFSVFYCTNALKAIANMETTNFDEGEASKPSIEENSWDISNEPVNYFI